MDYFFITDDKNEQEKLGRRIVEEKSEIYTKKTIDFIKHVIDDKLYNASSIKRESEFYRSIYHYWAYGCSVDEYLFLKFYDKNAEQIKDYITVHQKVLYLNRLNNKKDAHYLNNKYDAYLLLKEYFKRDMIKISSEEDYTKFLSFVEKHPDFVVKPVDMGLGDGVHKSSVKGLNNDEKEILFNDLLKEASSNIDKYWFGSEKAIVLEEIIEQDNRFAAFHAASVNSVRITTVKVNAETKIFRPWIKIGRGGQFVTSAAYGTFIAGIDEKTGVVVTPALNENNETYDIHPDTNTPILGFKIPLWEDAVKMVKEMAERLPNVGYIGWDIVLTPRGWCVMEGNFQGDFMWQMIYDKGCKKEFEELIGWKLEQKFWWE